MRSPRRRLLARVLGGLVALLLLAGVGGYWYARPLLLTGTGYAAHNACAVGFVAGREDAADDLPPNPLVPYLRSTLDSADHVASTSLFGVLARQRAWYSPGYGCTLADQRPSLAAAPPPAGANPLAAPAPAPPATAADRLDAALGAAFGDDLPADARAALGTRGVVVVHNGRVIAERYAPGFTAQTPQLGWSMAKSVTNLMAGRLVQQGTLAVTQDQLRPEWTDERRAITVDQLMRMTSGLRWDETYDLGTTITEMLYLQQDMAAFAASQPLAHAPGSYQQYSSGSTNILCSVLRSRTGPGTVAPERRLISELGLTSAVWEPDASGAPVCSSYLWATPRDWAAIGQFALQDGIWNGEQLLPPGWMTQSTRLEPTATSEEQGYAAGWWVNRLADGSLAWPAMPADTYWASGHDGQRVIVVPSADLVVVRLGFSPSIEPSDLRIDTLVQDLVAQTSR